MSEINRDYHKKRTQSGVLNSSENKLKIKKIKSLKVTKINDTNLLRQVFSITHIYRID